MCGSVYVRCFWFIRTWSCPWAWLTHTTTDPTHPKPINDSLYTCNITTSTPRPPPAPQPDDGDASAGPAPAPQLLSYDQLRPEDYPFTYFVFINANVDDSSSSQLLRAGEEDGPSSRAVNQTVRYAATFSPSYTPTQATLPQPAFALLLLLCAVCFLAMSAWVSAPALDFLDRRGWLPRARA